MDNYENLGTVGEGTYGIVMKCRHKESGQIVAIKKFKESDEDEQVRKTALREVRVLKQLRHDNIVNLIEVFRRKGKLYLVFEYLETTLLGKVEQFPHGLPLDDIKKYLYQLLKATEYCHEHNIIHRDIKLENLLISKSGILKLCDFGFARTLEGTGAKYTDYVSTRWYRAPELLVGDREYGKPVDVWAIGCIAAEIFTGEPLFPGESDIDQLFHIINCFGKISDRHVQIFQQNPIFKGGSLPTPIDEHDLKTLDMRFGNIIPANALDLIRRCLVCEPSQRASCAELMQSDFFDGLEEWYESELRQLIERDGISRSIIMNSKNNKQQQQTQQPSVSSKFKDGDQIRGNKDRKREKEYRSEDELDKRESKKKHTSNEQIPTNTSISSDQYNNNTLPSINTATGCGGGMSKHAQQATHVSRDDLVIPPIITSMMDMSIGSMLNSSQHDGMTHLPTLKGKRKGGKVQTQTNSSITSKNGLTDRTTWPSSSRDKNNKSPRLTANQESYSNLSKMIHSTSPDMSMDFGRDMLMIQKSQFDQSLRRQKARRIAVK